MKNTAVVLVLPSPKIWICHNLEMNTAALYEWCKRRCTASIIRITPYPRQPPIFPSSQYFSSPPPVPPYTQLPSSIIPFSPAYRQSPKLSTVTVHAYVPSNGNSEKEIKEPLLPKKEEIPAYPLHTAVLLNPLYRFLFFICVDFSQKCGYNIL